MADNISSRDSSVTRLDSKRPRQDSEENDQSGTICQRCDLLVAKVIDCAVCKLAFCLGCARISKILSQCLVEGELANFHWTCRSCRSMFPSIEGISSTVKDIQKNHEKRMSNMEERMSKMETITKHEIKSQVTCMKDEIIDSLKQDIHKVVDSRNKELEDRKRRELNLTIFNLKEHGHDVGRDNKAADEQDIIAISASLGLDNLNITTSYRLGKREQGKTGPLKIILDSKAQRKFLLDNARFIASKTSQRYQRVIISKDLTAEQRKERRERVQRRQQLRVSQRQIESNLNPSSDEDYVRATDGETQIVSMVVDGSQPSPIRGNQVLPHLNDVTNSDSDESSLSAYNDTTLIGDDTVIGGISNQEQHSDFDTQGGRLLWPPPAPPNVI